MPVRVIRRGHRGVRGSFPSRKAGRRVAFESRLERDHFLLLEADPGVRTFEEQPVTIEFAGKTGARHYTPDVRVEYHSGRTELVEVKYAEDLASMDAEKRRATDEAHAAARSYAAARGWTFRVVTNVEVRTPALARAEALFIYLRVPPDFERWRRRLLAAADERPGRTLADLVEAAGDRAARASALHLVWLGELADDPPAPPTDLTRLRRREVAQ